MQTFAVSDVTPSNQPLEAISLELSLAARLAEPIDEEQLLGSRGERSGLQPAVAIEASGANQEQLVRAPWA